MNDDDGEKPYGPTFVSIWWSDLIGAAAIVVLILEAITLAKWALGI